MPPQKRPQIFTDGRTVVYAPQCEVHDRSSWHADFLRVFTSTSMAYAQSMALPPIGIFPAVLRGLPLVVAFLLLCWQFWVCIRCYRLASLISAPRFDCLHRSRYLSPFFHKGAFFSPTNNPAPQGRTILLGTMASGNVKEPTSCTTKAAELSMLIATRHDVPIASSNP